MEITKFVDISLMNHNNINIVKFVVNHPLPTSLQWIIFIEDLKNLMQEIKNIKFGFLFNICNLGLIPYSNIKEFTDFMSSNGPLLENNLYGSSAIAEGSVIKYIFSIVKTVYKTKKPLTIVNNLDDALKFIEDNVY